MIRSMVRGDTIIARIYCDECGWQLSPRPKDPSEDEIADPLDPRKAEQHLCPQCYNRIMKRVVRSHCYSDCRYKPCMRGVCWVNPWPHIMYLCYIAERVDAYHPRTAVAIERVFGSVCA